MKSAGPSHIFWWEAVGPNNTSSSSDQFWILYAFIEIQIVVFVNKRMYIYVMTNNNICSQYVWFHGCKCSCHCVHLAKELLLESELRCARGVFGIHGVPPWRPDPVRIGRGRLVATGTCRSKLSVTAFCEFENKLQNSGSVWFSTVQHASLQYIIVSSISRSPIKNPRTYVDHSCPGSWWVCIHVSARNAR